MANDDGERIEIISAAGHTLPVRFWLEGGKVRGWKLPRSFRRWRGEDRTAFATAIDDRVRELEDHAP